MRFSRLPLLIAVCLVTVTAAQIPSPVLLVLNKEGTLAIVNPANKQIVATVRVGDTPHEAAASTDGKLAFVSNYGGSTPGNSLSVVAVASKKQIERVDLGPLRRPHGVA